MSRRALANAAVCAFAVGCASLSGFTPLPKSQDVKMGRAYAAEVDKKMPVEKDAALNEGVARVGRRIVEANAIADYEFVFKVVRDDKTVNAFALPGGKIYVFTGLIARADDEAELAGVLAHEIAHVTERHSSKRMVDQVTIEAIEAIALGRLGPARSGASAVTKVGFLSYSRSQESDADTVGVELLEKTDYDPRGLVRFFEKIKALEKGESSVVTRFLSDHPASSDRIESVSEEIKKLPASRQTGETYTERWLAYRAKVCPAQSN